MKFWNFKISSWFVKTRHWNLMKIRLSLSSHVVSQFSSSGASSIMLETDMAKEARFRVKQPWTLIPCSDGWNSWLQLPGIALFFFLPFQSFSSKAENGNELRTVTMDSRDSVSQVLELIPFWRGNTSAGLSVWFFSSAMSFTIDEFTVMDGLRESLKGHSDDMSRPSEAIFKDGGFKVN